MACIIAILFDFTMYYTRFTKLYHVLYHVLFNYIMYLLCNIELYNVHSHIICLPIAEWPFSLRTHPKKRSRTASWPFSLVTYAKSYAFQQLSDPFHCGHTPKNDPEQLRDPFHSWHMQNHMPSNSWVTLFIADTRQKTIPNSFVTLFTRDICKIICLPTAEWPFSLRTHAKKRSRPASWPFSTVTYAKSQTPKQLRDPFHCGHTQNNHMTHSDRPDRRFPQKVALKR